MVMIRDQFAKTASTRPDTKFNVTDTVSWTEDFLQ